jgi:ecotin
LLVSQYVFAIDLWVVFWHLAASSYGKHYEGADIRIDKFNCSSWGGNMSTVCPITALSIFFAVISAQAADIMKAFPPAGEGMVRYVLQLPKQEDESIYKVELIVGKTVQVDEKNRYFFGGNIEKETIKGWGYPRYIVSKLGPMTGTLMAVDPNVPKVARFVTLVGEPYIIRYNSRLPIVVYVPEDVEVRYRIWTTGAETKAMEKG